MAFYSLYSLATPPCSYEFLNPGSVIMDLPQVSVHPLVLLSIVDHYRRVVSVSQTNSNKRVVGVLLGQWHGRQVSLTNSYALPFEENPSDPSVWFLDHNYHETMAELFKKVNARERIVGWYHSGPRLRSSDLLINQVFRRYCAQSHQPPILLIADPHQREDLCAYQAVEEIAEDGSAHQHTWAHLPLRLEAEEAEEIGVEHLLRDVEGTDSLPRGSTAERLMAIKEGLNSMQGGLSEMEEYLQRVQRGEMPLSPSINKHLQELVNALPQPTPILTDALSLAANDHLAAIWTGSLIRSVIALHNLIDNKLKLDDE